MSLPDDLNEVLETEVTSLNLEKHPYFVALASGAMSKQGFIDSQMQLSYLVRSFSGPMAAIVAHIPSDEIRLTIVDKLWAEYGVGHPEKIHGKGLLALIERLGGDISVLETRQASAAIDSFNTSLKAIAKFEDHRVSAAVLAGVERSFAEASALIFGAIVQRGWLPAEQVVHYALRDEDAMDHAQEFARVVGEDWLESELNQAMIKCGIKLGAALFARVFTNLAQAPAIS